MGSQAVAFERHSARVSSLTWCSSTRHFFVTVRWEQADRDALKLFVRRTGEAAVERVRLSRMKDQLKVSTPAEYIAKLEEPRRTEVAALDALIRKTAPKLEPFIHSGVLGLRSAALQVRERPGGRLVPHRRGQQQERHFSVHLRGR
jgi:hypothetical protein